MWEAEAECLENKIARKERNTLEALCVVPTANSRLKSDHFAVPGEPAAVRWCCNRLPSNTARAHHWDLPHDLWSTI
jgi:hypothetical protein